MSSFRDDLVALLPNFRRFALVLTGSVHDGEDMVHSAIERALRHEGSWKEGSRLDSWMFKIIQNLWIDELRAKRRQTMPLEMIEELPGEDGRETTANQLDLETAKKALLELPTEQRLVLCLIVMEGMSYQEAATTLDVPIGTIMSRLSRARAAMASRVSNEPLRVTSATP